MDLSNASIRDKVQSCPFSGPPTRLEEEIGRLGREVFPCYLRGECCYRPAIDLPFPWRSVVNLFTYVGLAPVSEEIRV